MGEPQRWADGRGRPKGATAKWLRARAEARRAGGEAWAAWQAAHPGGVPTPAERAAATKARRRRGRGRGGKAAGAGAVAPRANSSTSISPRSPGVVRATTLLTGV